MKHFSSWFKHGLIALIAAGTILTVRSRAAVTIEADNPNISYIGRFDTTDPKNVRLDWTATTIKVNFTGTSVSVAMSTRESLSFNRPRFAVVIDGKVKDILEISTRNKQYTLVTGLAGGEHTLELVKRNFHGIAVFSGLVLDDGAAVSAPVPAKYHIEFLGDSYTSAYGNESDSSYCTWKQVNLLTNAYLGYAGLTARAVGADLSVVAYPGGGLVHNAKDSLVESAMPIPAYYERALYHDTTGILFNMDDHSPDLVVVALGINDLNDKVVVVSEDLYKQKYHALIDRLEAYHPGVQILCLAFGYPKHFTTWLQTVVEEEKTGGNKNIHFVNAGSMLGTSVGCHKHPGLASHEHFANTIIPTIQNILKDVPGNGTTDIRDLQDITYPEQANRQATWFDITGRKVMSPANSTSPRLMIRVTDGTPNLQVRF